MAMTFYALYCSAALASGLPRGSCVDGMCAAAQPCNIARLDALDAEAIFRRDYWGKQPVVVPTQLNEKFRALTTRASMLGTYGELPVELSTANTFTGRDWEKRTLAEYLASMAAQRDDLAGNNSWYLFGNTYGAGWKSLLAEYGEPALAALGTGLAFDVNNGATSVSFGLAGFETGVPFHRHADGWSEVIHGAKRWFLFPPGHEVGHDPNATTQQWVHAHYAAEAVAGTLRECVIRPGDALYFPPDWPHATLNLGEYNAFASTFL